MKHRFPSTLTVALLLVAASALTACGGSDHGDGLADAQREDRAASASSAGLLSFATGQMARSTNDSADPRSVTGITPPANDTSEPFLL
jgi:hypothetical protein